MAALLILSPPRTSIQYSINAFDSTNARGLYGTEISQADGRLFRWTDGSARMVLPRQGSGPAHLSLTLAAPLADVQRVQLRAQGHPLADIALERTPRRYELLVPADSQSWQTTTVTIASQISSISGDRRSLGVLLAQVRWAALEDWPQLRYTQFLVLVLAVVTLYGALRRMGCRAWSDLAVVLFVVISVALQHSDIRVDHRMRAGLLSAGLALIFGTVWIIAARWPLVQNDSHTTRSGGLFGPFLVLSAVALITFAPLLPRIGDLIYGWPGDNFEYIWKIGWVAEALTERRASPLFQPAFFYPSGFDLVRSELTPAHSFPGALISLVAGPVVAYNLLLIADTVLTGLFTVMLAEDLGATRFGALAAGIGLAFCSFRFIYAMGTLPIAGTQWIVLALLGWERFLQWQRPLDALITGLGLALSAWASWYYGTTLPFFLVLYTLIRVPLSQWRVMLGHWRAILPGVLVSIALLAPYGLPYLHLGAPAHERAELLSGSTIPLVYLLPNPFQFFWGASVIAATPGIAVLQRFSIGYGVLILAAISMSVIRPTRTRWGIFLLGVFWCILSFGPELQIGTQALPLPVDLIYQSMPILNQIRVWSRMAFYVQLCATLLAGLGASILYHRSALQRAVALGLVALVLLESISVMPWVSSTAARPVDVWLANQSIRGAVLHLPDTLSGSHEFQTRTTGLPLVAGYGTFFPEYFLNDYFAMQRFPEPQAFAAIAHLRPTYLVIDTQLMDQTAPGWRIQLDPRPGYHAVYQDATTRVYKLEYP